MGIRITRLEETRADFNRHEVIEMLVELYPKRTREEFAAYDDDGLACELRAGWETCDDIAWQEYFTRRTDKRGRYDDEWKFESTSDLRV